MSSVARSLSDQDFQVNLDSSFDSAVAGAADQAQQAEIINFGSLLQSRRRADLPRWVCSVFPAMYEFLSLPKGWDTYNGQPLNLDTGMFALKILYDVMSPRTPVPMVAPTPDGGIQFEWHTRDIDLDFFVAAPYECELTFRDRATGADESIELTTDFSELSRLISKIQEQVRRVG
jgi:hypothetical protein